MSTATGSVLDWVRASDEPWTRYRTLIDLDQASGADIENARRQLLDQDRLRGLLAKASAWPGYPLRRHNDARHPLYALATLADFGLTKHDDGIASTAERILDHFDGEGFESLLWLPRFLTGDSDREGWGWMLCDAPTLLYTLLAFWYGEEAAVRKAVASLSRRVADNGWRCAAAESLPSFGGPGRTDDPCPMATTYALKALSLIPEEHNREPVRRGVATLLAHWEHQRDYKLRMFGIGTDFRKLKYPYVWYDILHVAEVLSRFEAASVDPRLIDMVSAITAQADAHGRYTAGSMYRAWKEWSFADKRRPSPWLTFLVLRIERRLTQASTGSNSASSSSTPS
jgi:hypothetical protein